MGIEKREEMKTVELAMRSAPPKEEAPVLESNALFGENREIAIRHEGQVYRLRITRYGKLVLNK